MRDYINPVADYEFVGSAGIDNCDYCDNFIHVNEWRTPDNDPHYVCGKCAYVKRFPEIPRETVKEAMNRELDEVLVILERANNALLSRFNTK